jgi:phosphoglycerate dehydrogenase-like enzyme
MQILINDTLDLHHLKQIQAVCEHLELVIPDSREEALEKMPEIEVVFGGVNLEMFKRAERLVWVQTWGAGIDGMLYPEFVASNVILTSAKGTVGVHLSEHAFALLLALTRGIGCAVRNPQWDQRVAIRQSSWELINLTMGIVGMGGTGLDVAKRAHAFGMRIVAIDPEEVSAPDYVEKVWQPDRLGDLLAQSDVVVICCPLTKKTKGLFDAWAFGQMQKHALLINVTRGPIVDEKALLDALNNGSIAGAGLDVTPQEPLPPGHPLWTMDNVIITPHTAGGSPNRQNRIVNLFCDNLRRLKAGETLLSVIDKEKEY